MSGAEQLQRGFSRDKADDPASVAATLNAQLDPAAIARYREVRSWDDVQFVFRSKFFDPGDDGMAYKERMEFLGDAVGRLQGRDHFERRRIEGALLTSAHLSGLEEGYLRPAVKRALTHAAKSRGADGLVRADLVGLCNQMVLDLMAAVIGLDEIIGDAEVAARFRLYYADLDAAIRARFTTDDFNGVMERGLAARERFMAEFFAPSLARREQLVADVEAGKSDRSTLPLDLITLIVLHKEHFDRFDPKVAEHEVMNYLAGALGSTASGACLAVADIEQWLEANPDQSHQRSDDAFLERAISESLRFHTRAFTNRVALGDCVLPSGKEIQAGELIWVNMRAADRERFGVDADEYNPYRQQPEGKGDRSGIAFGDGRHTCVGKWMLLGEGSKTRPGSLLTIIKELYAAGVRIDPAMPMTLAPSIRESVESMPVVFDKL